MAGGQNAGFKAGFDSLIYEKDLEENPPYVQSTPSQPAPMLIIKPERHYRLAAVVLAVLAAVLLMVDIGLGAHYKQLTDTHLTIHDAELIGKELEKLQYTYSGAVKNTTEAHKELENEMSNQKQVNWEFEHYTKLGKDYQEQIAKLKTDIDTMKSHMPLIHGGCKHCSPGWILVNSVCYYLAFSRSDGLKSWQQARDFCKVQGGDLTIIDSKDKEKMIVNQLMNHKDRLDSSMGFWIGLKNKQTEGTWKWTDGKQLDEAYWDDGEPNIIYEENCVSMYPRENFFKAWNDNRCTNQMKWICEKASNE